MRRFRGRVRARPVRWRPGASGPVIRNLQLTVAARQNIPVKGMYAKRASVTMATRIVAGHPPIFAFRNVFRAAEHKAGNSSDVATLETIRFQVNCGNLASICFFCAAETAKRRA